MKFTTPTTLAAIALIGAGGFMAGRISSPDGGSAERGDGPEATRPARTSARDRSSDQKPGAERAAKRGRRGNESDFSGAGERDARLSAIIRGENPLDRNRALLEFIDGLGADDFEEAVAHFRSLGLTEDRMGEYALLLSAWAKTDPLAALDFASANTNGRFATNTILTTWASEDADGAIRWAETHHESDGENPYYSGIIRSLAETDPQRAEWLLTSMSRSVERGEALDAMLPSVLARGGADARAWISAIEDDSLRNGAMLRAVGRLAMVDPQATATWLMDNPGEATQRRLDDVYSAWAKQDQGEALQSLATLESGDLRSNALRGVVSSIAGEDPRAAVSLMDRYPEDVNDRVVRNFIWHSFGTDPAVAVDQIARIEDERFRNRMYDRAVPRWIESDPAAANSWLSRNPLPEAVQERLNRRQAEQ